MLPFQPTETYHLWFAVFDWDAFDSYWDNEPYQEALRLWKTGAGPKPSEDMKSGFCREMGLEELDGEDWWFRITRHPAAASKLAEPYNPADIRALERACLRRGIRQANVIWALRNVYPGLQPDRCVSMSYAGLFEFFTDKENLT